MITFLIALTLVAWIAVAALGSQAYFRGEQSKPIHGRNWKSEGFETIAVAVTGSPTDYNDRIPGFEVVDAYGSQSL